MQKILEKKTRIKTVRDRIKGYAEILVPWAQEFFTSLNEWFQKRCGLDSFQDN